MLYEGLEGSLNPKNCFDVVKFRLEFDRSHPDYFKPEGLLIFCGSQGSGKTLSAVQYVQEVCRQFPKAILCTNTTIHGLPEETVVVEYMGLDSLKNIENGEFGVVYFIDEIHLEFNSLESKNIPIEVMVEVSQQRKQRKHIIGTSQVYTRLAKPFREQIKNVVICKKVLNCIQYNVLIDGDSSREEGGKLVYEKTKSYIWFHRPELYKSYDTYAKMKRYRKEWQGRPMRSWEGVEL